MKALVRLDYNTHFVRNAKEKTQEHQRAQCPPHGSPCKENTKKATGEALKEIGK